MRMHHNRRQAGVSRPLVIFLVGVAVVALIMVAWTILGWVYGPEWNEPPAGEPEVEAPVTMRMPAERAYADRL